MIHYEEVLYQVYAPLPFTFSFTFNGSTTHALNYSRLMIRIPAVKPAASVTKTALKT